MKKIEILIFLLFCTTRADEQPQDCASLVELLNERDLDNNIFRAPPIPATLGAPIGSVNFQGYNGGTVTPTTIGAVVGGYSALPTSTTPTADQTFPANIIMSTVPTSGGTGTARINVQANGRVGIGNFAPADSTNANAALNVEGAISSVGDSMVHVGSRTTALTGFTSMTGGTRLNYNLQVDGNLVVNNGTLVNNATTPTAITGVTGASYAQGQFNLLPFTYIRTIPAGGITINTPGVYRLANNISFTPTGINPAIVIGASGVVLDFQSFTITQTNSTTPVDCISVNNGVTDIMITNGAIKSFTNNGISVGNSVARIAVQDMSIVSCGVGAIAVTGIASPRNDTLYINNCKALLCGASGTNNSIISCQQTNNVFINQLLVSQASAASGTLNGISIANANNVLVYDAQVINSQAPNLRGIFLNSVNSGKFTECSITGNNNNTGASGAELSGIRLNSSSGVLFIDCSVLSNTSTVSAAVVLAFYMNGSSNCSFSRCVAGGQIQTGGGTPTIAPRGMFIDNTSLGITCRDCIFYRNDAITPIVPAGVEVQGNNCAFINCTSHSALTNTGTVAGVGFLVTATSTTVGARNSFNRCNAFNNATGFQIVISGTATNTQNQFVKNISTKNTTNYSGFPAAASVSTVTMSGLTGLNSKPWTNVDI